MQANSPRQLKKEEEEFSYELGKILRRTRLDSGLTQQEMGDIIGVTFQQIQKYESGANRLSVYKMKIWAKATNLHPTYFCEDNSQKPYPRSRNRLTTIRELDKLPISSQLIIGKIVRLISEANLAEEISTADHDEECAS